MYVKLDTLLKISTLKLSKVINKFKFGKPESNY